MAAELTLFLTITGEPGAPRVSLNVAKNVTATELRKQASETTKIPLESIKIIYRGKMIRDDDTSDAVSVFKLEEGSVLHCMGKPVKDAPAVDSTATAPVVGVGSTVTLNPSGAAAAAASSNTAVISATPTEQSDPLKAALQNMRNSNTPAVYQTAVATLDKLLGNIIAFPLEEKYRRVKKLNASFQKRLGGVQGGDSAILASGFINQTDNGDQFYVMEASPEAWPRLTAAKATLEIAVRETTAAAATSGNSMPMDLPSMFAGGLPGMPAVMDDSYMQNMMENPMMRNMMSDPAALQNMMRNPMIQNMMRNDPRIASNPMMQLAMEEIANNPMMAEQLSALMRDPSMVRNIQAQMAQAQQNGGASNYMPPIAPGILPPNSVGGQVAGNNRDQQGQSGAPSANDDELTEEEMIAEAIRRSLQDREGGS